MHRTYKKCTESNHSECSLTLIARIFLIGSYDLNRNIQLNARTSFTFVFQLQALHLCSWGVKEQTRFISCYEKKTLQFELIIQVSGKSLLTFFKQLQYVSLRTQVANIGNQHPRHGT